MKYKEVFRLRTIRKNKELESNSQPRARPIDGVARCELSAKIKNLKAIHNAYEDSAKAIDVANYPQK